MLRGKVAIVTGGTSGIGYAIAKMFVAEGAKVVVGAIDGVDETKKELGCEGVLCNLASAEGCKKLYEYTKEKYGTVDILINNAGIQHVCPIDEFPEDKWEFMIDLMLNTPFRLTKYCWPDMKEKGWGRVINTSSIHGLVASEFKSCYVTAKHGLYGMTKAAALEGGPLGITVNCFCPAYVRTPLVEKQIASQAKVHNMPEDEVVEKVMLAKAAIKKMVPAEHIAETVKFLCSDAASSITGIALPIDGGWTAN